MSYEILRKNFLACMDESRPNKEHLPDYFLYFLEGPLIFIVIVFSCTLNAKSKRIDNVNPCMFVC
jgi:hypothetical protein